MLNYLGTVSKAALLKPSQIGKKLSFCSRFRRDEDGSLIIFSLFLLIMMLMISGMAVDLMRAETHRARLQSTLDRAVLAGASLQQTLNSEDVVRDYFDKAGLGAYLTDVAVIEDSTSKTVTASAQLTAGTYFMKLLGVDHLSAPAAGEAEESISDIEVSLVLDVSGSMGSTSASGNTKMEDLIEAAQEFVYLMQCDPDAEKPYDNVCTVPANTVSISLIPYAEQVLVGEEMLQEFNITNEHTDSSCVDFNNSDFQSASMSLT
ncbi:MAG: TadE/TadG family type IV pilus assembly protein, partial [Paracoccaceae bacterium]